MKSGCIIREWGTRFCRKTEQASIQEGKSDNKKRAIGNKESKTASTGTIATGAGTGGETKNAAGRREEEIMDRSNSREVEANFYCILGLLYRGLSILLNSTSR